MKSLKIEPIVDVTNGNENGNENENVKKKANTNTSTNTDAITKIIGTVQIESKTESETKHELKKEKQFPIEVEKPLFFNEQKYLHKQDKNNQNNQQIKTSIDGKHAIDYEQNIDNTFHSTLNKDTRKYYLDESKSRKGQQKNNGSVEVPLSNLLKVNSLKGGSNMTGKIQTAPVVVEKETQKNQKESTLKAAQMKEERKKLETEKEEKELENKKEMKIKIKKIDNTEKDVFLKKRDDKDAEQLENVEQIKNYHPKKLGLQDSNFRLNAIYRELYNDLQKENSTLKQEIEKLKTVVEKQNKIIHEKTLKDKLILTGQEATLPQTNSNKSNEYTKNLINFFNKKKKSFICLNEKKRSFIKKKKKVMKTTIHISGK